MKIQARRKTDGGGLYAWRPVVRTRKGLALDTSIYRKAPADDLDESETAEAFLQLARAGYEWRECE